MILTSIFLSRPFALTHSSVMLVKARFNHTGLKPDAICWWLLASCNEHQCTSCCGIVLPGCRRGFGCIVTQERYKLTQTTVNRSVLGYGGVSRTSVFCRMQVFTFQRGRGGDKTTVLEYCSLAQRNPYPPAWHPSTEGSMIL